MSKSMKLNSLVVLILFCCFGSECNPEGACCAGQGNQRGTAALIGVLRFSG